jgi:hypothetical protein
MNFRYEQNTDDTDVDITNSIVCYSDMKGTMPITTWSKHVDLNLQYITGSVCLNLGTDVQRCKTIKVKMTVEVTVGVVTVSDIHFGDVSICSNEGLQKKEDLLKLECEFENSDCGIKNDACGLVNWEIQSDGSSQEKSGCEMHPGISLLKEKIQHSCSYEDLKIADLQPSGFAVVSASSKNNPTPKPKKNGSVKGKRSAGYHLILDPSNVPGVAVGVLNLPGVQRASPNAFLTFYHEMVAGGLHDLLVTAVCLSDPALSLVPLDAFSVHYHRSNFDGNGSEGVICLNIHKYVDEFKCTEFVIQIKAAAVETAVIVDTIFFADSLSSTVCDKADNN